MRPRRRGRSRPSAPRPSIWNGTAAPGARDSRDPRHEQRGRLLQQRAEPGRHSGDRRREEAVDAEHLRGRGAANRLETGVISGNVPNTQSRTGSTPSCAPIETANGSRRNRGPGQPGPDRSGEQRDARARAARERERRPSAAGTGRRAATRSPRRRGRACSTRAARRGSRATRSRPSPTRAAPTARTASSPRTRATIASAAAVRGPKPEPAEQRRGERHDERDVLARHREQVRKTGVAVRVDDRRRDRRACRRAGSRRRARAVVGASERVPRRISARIASATASRPRGRRPTPSTCVPSSRPTACRQRARSS